jgi:hypothetical protein
MTAPRGCDTRAIALAMLVLAAIPEAIAAQGATCASPVSAQREWVALCADGNGIPALRRPVDVPRGTLSVGDALEAIARAGSVDITLDAGVAALRDQVTLPGGRAPIAEALLRVGADRALEIDVTRDGSIIVVAAPPRLARRDQAADAADSLRRIATLSRVIVSARRDAAHPEGLPLTGSLTYGTRELGGAPGFFGNDVLRAARLLPGLAARNDFSTALNARGGESDQTLVMLDGIPIYYPFHLGGLLGSFIEPAVAALDMYTGVLPARYDGRLSALLDVRSAAESRPGVHGTADVNLLSSTASLGGTTRSSATSWLVAGRRTYADAAAKLVGRDLPYHFQDANLHVTHRLSSDARLELTAYAGTDVADVRLSDTVLAHASNAAVGAAWSSTGWRAADGGSMLGADSVGLLQRVSLTTFDAVLDAPHVDLRVRSHVRDARIAGSLTAYGARGSHAVGYELMDQRPSFSIGTPPFEFRNFAPGGRASGELVTFGAWYEGRRALSSALLVQGGGRVDLVRGVGAFVAPRLSTRLALASATALTAAVGRQGQWMHSALREEVPARLLDFWVASDSALPPARAWIYSLGLERDLGRGRDLRIEAFHKQLAGIVVRNTLDDSLITGDELTRAHGRSSGVDILLRQAERDGFSGWLSYSFALSARTDASGVAYVPAQDRRHELNAVGSWHAGSYLLGARFGLASGTPYTPVIARYNRLRYDPVNDVFGVYDGRPTTQYILGERNGERFPFSHRLDLSLTRIGRDGAARTTPYLSIANVYGAFNPVLYVYSLSSSPGIRYATSGFRFLPTFGVRHVF